MLKNWNTLLIISVLFFAGAVLLLVYVDSYMKYSEGMFAGLGELFIVLILYIISYIYSVIALIQIFKTGQKGRLISVLIIISPIVIFFMMK